MALLGPTIVNGHLNVSGKTQCATLRLDSSLFTFETIPILGLSTSSTPAGDQVCTARQVKNYITMLNLYDKTLYTEPDGSKWLHVFHHNNPTSYKFSSGNTFTGYLHIDANRYFDIGPIAGTISSEWEIIATQSNTSGATTSVYRWKQSYNPMTATHAQTVYSSVTKVTGSTNFVSGGSYATLSSSYGGIHRYGSSSNTYLVQNCNSSGSWWGATGCWEAYQGGIPGYNGAVCSTGVMDLYLRIDTHSTLY